MKKLLKILMWIIILLSFAFGALVFIEYTNSTKPEIPLEIIVTDKTKVFSSIDNFVDVRGKLLSIHLDKLEELCKEIVLTNKISKASIYEDGEILSIFLNTKTSTAAIAEEFVEKNPYGAYIKEEDMQFLQRKVRLQMRDMEDRYESILNKYKNKLSIGEDKYSVEELINIYINAHKIKDFLDKTLTQEDINKSINKLKQNTIKGNPDLWESIMLRKNYKGDIFKYEVDIFSLEHHPEYQSLEQSARLIIEDVLRQSVLSYDYGYEFNKLSDLKINDYLGKSRLKRISTMIAIAVDIESITTNKL